MKNQIIDLTFGKYFFLDLAYKLYSVTEISLSKFSFRVPPTFSDIK